MRLMRSHCLVDGFREGNFREGNTTAVDEHLLITVAQGGMLNVSGAYIVYGHLLRSVDLEAPNRNLSPA